MELFISKLFIEFVLFELAIILIAACYVALANYYDHGTVR